MISAILLLIPSAVTLAGVGSQVHKMSEAKKKAAERQSLQSKIQGYIKNLLQSEVESKPLPGDNDMSPSKFSLGYQPEMGSPLLLTALESICITRCFQSLVGEHSYKDEATMKRDASALKFLIETQKLRSRDAMELWINEGKMPPAPLMDYYRSML